MYYKQQSINLFLAWYDSQPVCTVIYSKSLLFTSISYLQESFRLSQSWINVFFCIGGFPFIYLLSLALAKKSCNNINNSPTQVSRLCYFLWLCLHVLQGLLVIKYTKKLLNVVEKYFIYFGKNRLQWNYILKIFRCYSPHTAANALRCWENHSTKSWSGDFFREFFLYCFSDLVNRVQKSLFLHAEAVIGCVL